ncbi:MAG: hydroxyisourate hydrolase [Pseudomonadota bacterium]
MPGYLTTHVLDTALGCPAEGIQIELYRLESGARTHLRTLITNDDGRTDTPILPKEDFRTGRYELIFYAGSYLDRSAPPVDGPRFLDQIPIRFAMTEANHYHVPLLLSPYGYSTYRGS